MGRGRGCLGKRGVRNSRDWLESFGTRFLLLFVGRSVWWMYLGTGDAVAGIPRTRTVLVRDGRRSIKSIFSIR